MALIPHSHSSPQISHPTDTAPVDISPHSPHPGPTGSTPPQHGDSPGFSFEPLVISPFLALFPHFLYYFPISCITFPSPSGPCVSRGHPSPMLTSPSSSRGGIATPSWGRPAPKEGWRGRGASPWPHGLMETFYCAPKNGFFFQKIKIKNKTPSCRPPSGRARRGSAPLSLSPQGPVTMEESTQGVLRVLAGLSASSNGTFWDWRGQRLPW